MPVISCSAPIGRWIATQCSDSCSCSAPRTRKKSARSRSSMFTKRTRDRLSVGGALPVARGLNLDAHHGADDEERALDDTDRRDRVALEARVARRVDQVDLPALPLEVADRRGERHLPSLLVLVPVGDGSAGLDRAQPVDRPGLEEHRLDERGLARTAVADDGDVANLPRLRAGMRSTPPRLWTRSFATGSLIGR